jgi:elongation factor P
VAEIVEAEEAVQGNTVQAVQKKAWITTGYEISVPQFIRKGDRVLINTSTGEYVGRTK